MSFTRVRQRTTNVASCRMVLDEMASNPCRLATSTNFDVSFSDTQLTMDSPDGLPYLPGSFKITDIFMLRNSYTVSDIYGMIYHDSGSCPSAVISGQYCSRLAYTPSAGFLDIDPIVASQVERLMLHAYSKLSEPRVDYGENLATLSQTVGLLRNPVAALSGLLESVLYSRNGRRAFQEASTLWLQKRYAWDPMISDIQEIWNKNTMAYNDATIYDEVGQKTDKDYTEGLKAFYRLKSRSNLAIEAYPIQSKSKTERVRVYFRLLDPGMYHAVKQGKSVFNALNLAWNLIPLSFVLDWWFDIGRFLNASSPKPYLQLLGATYSQRKNQATSSVVTRSLNLTLERYARSAAGQNTETKDLYLREVIPLPDSWAIPKVNADFRSWKHVADSVSLFIQRIR